MCSREIWATLIWLLRWESAHTTNNLQLIIALQHLRDVKSCWLSLLIYQMFQFQWVRLAMQISSSGEGVEFIFCSFSDANPRSISWHDLSESQSLDIFAQSDFAGDNLIHFILFCWMEEDIESHINFSSFFLHSCRIILRWGAQMCANGYWRSL